MGVRDPSIMAETAPVTTPPGDLLRDTGITICELEPGETLA